MGKDGGRVKGEVWEGEGGWWKGEGGWKGKGEECWRGEGWLGREGFKRSRSLSLYLTMIFEIKTH